MGRTPKPLKFLVHQSLIEVYPWHELVAQGHLVVFMAPEEPAFNFDLILAPNAWKMDTRLIKYLDLAVKAARTIKYPKKEKKA